MSTRLQVVMDEEELDEIREAADRGRMTVSEWVRMVLREARAHGVGPGAAVREPRAPYSTAPGGLGRRVHVDAEVKDELIRAVQDRYHLSSPRAAIEFALRRAAVVPMSKEEALDMEGTGWDGDLDALRSGDPGSPW